jgi:MOSC domain-containing protein YiiM
VDAETPSRGGRRGEGTIVQVSISRGGIPKYAIEEGFITPLGIEGDMHAHPQFHGGPLQAILIISAEMLEILKQQGYPVFYGAMGENLTVGGVEFKDIRIGDEIRAGGALLEITKPRTPCQQLDVYGATFRTDIYDALAKRRDPASPHWGLSGFYASVLEPGPVRAGDRFAVVSKLA